MFSTLKEYKRRRLLLERTGYTYRRVVHNILISLSVITRISCKCLIILALNRSAQKALKLYTNHVICHSVIQGVSRQSMDSNQLSAGLLIVVIPSVLFDHMRQFYNIFALFVLLARLKCVFLSVNPQTIDIKN